LFIFMTNGAVRLPLAVRSAFDPLRTRPSAAMINAKTKVFECFGGIMTIFAFAAAAAAQALAASPTNVLSFKEAGRIIIAAERKHAETRSRIRGWSNEQLASELTTAISGKTKLIYQLGHGVYVEYTDPQGQLRMWYPKNKDIVRGSWGVRDVRGKMRACFQYSNAVNPVTHVYEPTECVAAEQTLSGAEVLQSWNGDVFHLMENRIPYSKDAMDMPSPLGS
jgi:hypothetical protein